jgi:DNA-binding transcriptional LysR family regulator
MDLNSLQTFVAVVRAGGFAAAARQTNAPRSSVSLRIRNLEHALGIRLFKRSTRAFSLTAEGAELYQRSAEALSSLTEALAGISRAGDSYAGKIRVTVPADFPAGIVAAAIAEFRGAHPAVQFEVLLTNDVLDLVSENIDIALRIGASNPQESLVRRAIDMDFGLYASVEYLRINGEPATIEAVSTLIGPQRPELRRLLSRALKAGVEFPQFQIAVEGFTLVRELVLLHQGVGLLPQSLCRAELASGTVVPVLPKLFSGSTRLHLTFPSRADLSPKVSSFAQVLVRHLGAASRR